MRERGLKYDLCTYDTESLEVAPHAGAWIEIVNPCFAEVLEAVAPHAGAWIEI